jgi:biotin operon repressor
MAKPGPSPTVALDDVLGVFSDRDDSNEPLTAPEIADVLGCSRATVNKRLTELGDRGILISKKVGGRSRVWWPSPASSKDRDLLKGYGSWTGTGLAAAVEETREQLDADLREDDRVLSG